MLVYALQEGVGAVGAKLFFPDGRLQHAGVIAKGGVVGHTYYQGNGNSCGYWGNLIVPTDHLAVTAACLMVRRGVFDEVGGLDEDLPVNYNDVDFCLRIHAKGYRNVLLPHVELLHRESASRGPAPVKPREIAAMQERWGDLLHHDPYYDPRFVNSEYEVPRDHTPLGLARRARDLYARDGVRGLAMAVRAKVAREGIEPPFG
jgi:GT2 family glycosyltransferase